MLSNTRVLVVLTPGCKTTLALNKKKKGYEKEKLPVQGALY